MSVSWAVLVLVLLVLWRVRKIERVLARTPVKALSLRASAPPSPAQPETWRGAEAPNRYVVVRWPSGQKPYEGCVARLARETFEHSHPLPGESVELWETTHRRGRKVA